MVAVIKLASRLCLASLTVFVSVGCAELIEIASVGAGKSATADDTGFLKSYQELAPVKDSANPNLPDLSYISPQARVSAYTRVLMPDFTSMTRDVGKVDGLQIRQYKGIKQELPDRIADTLQGSTFSTVTRTSERIDPRDTAAIRRLPADAVLMGNIKELVSAGQINEGLTSMQTEYKLIDVRTGEEVVTAIHRNTSDADKVALSQVRILAALFNMAKSGKFSSPGVVSPTSAQTMQESPQAAAPTARAEGGARAAQIGGVASAPIRAMTPKEVQERLIALGYSPGAPDGVIGKNTVNALKKFQQDKGIPVTGKIDQETISKLRGI